ncbi:MAG: DUF4268 domain-containing protein [Chloroflexi bacterium]|nr:DUF4268 domain-containing protein [Chloroflexota bacterium]MBI5714293.1 DUF4268 domain-containing protein [Chloroflexota bacterium]
MNISRLTKIPLRELWKHEARGFTHWLAENLDYLNEALDIELSLVEREASGGMTFSADILAEDASGNYYIIENQLEKTDHDHLGKIITYMSNLDGNGAIWITSEPRPEHEKAIHWLNEILPADSAVYLVKLEAYKIEDSPSAPLFTVIAGPTSVSKQVGDEKKELAERHIQRLEFWKQILEKYKKRGTFFSNISPAKDHWINTGAGKAGVAYSQIVMMDALRVEVYISSSNQEANKRYFDQLLAHKEKIEKIFGKPLVWQRLNEKTASRICYTIEGRGLKDKEQWDEMQEMLVEEMYNLRKAFQDEIDKLK